MTADANRADDEASGPRRSGLVQERSRRTREQLMIAALKLWGERGYERGVQETTVEEIVREAGVTKGTFYFHFGHKEDILLELGYRTAEGLVDEAEEAIAKGTAGVDILYLLVESLAFGILQVPPAAVSCTLAELYRYGPQPAPRALGLCKSFEIAMTHAAEHGDVPADFDVGHTATMLEAALLADALEWAANAETTDLGRLMRRSVDVLVAGAAAVAEMPRER